MSLESSILKIRYVLCSASERNKNIFFTSLVGLLVTTSLLMTWQLGMFVKS